MSKVKKILNFSESVLELKLKKALQDSGCRVFPSVNIGDVLQISRDELSKQEFELALKSHFDFIVTEKDTKPLFAVEFDGPVHQRQAKILIDKTKNSICAKYGFPILRIDQDLLHKKVSDFELVEWLVELHFICSEFYAMQEQGKIPYDEPWYYGSLINFDPFIRLRALALDWQQKGLIKSGVPYHLTTLSGDNYYYTLTAYEFADDQWIVGEARCRIFMFPAISAAELSAELSMVVAVEKIHSKLKGGAESLWSLVELKERLESLRPHLCSEGGRLLDTDR